jgi:hypothetical protein
VNDVTTTITISIITTTERMKPPHMSSSDIIVNNLKDMFLLSSLYLWSEASKHGLCINSTKHQLRVLEELWDPHSNFHLKEMIVSNTDCELKGEEKEVLRAAHNINDDGVTSVDKGETTKAIKSQIFSSERKTSQTGPGSSEI